MDAPLSVGERLTLLRTQGRAFQVPAGKDMYTTRQVIRRWETGEQQLKLDDAVRIADYFGVSLDWLAGRNGKNGEKQNTGYRSRNQIAVQENRDDIRGKKKMKEERKD